MGVRNNIWKDRDFDCFIPLYINREHGRRSLPLAEECILELWNCEELPVHHELVTAELVLDTLTKLMNTTVVNMMKTVEDLEAGELQLFDSIKALGGYASMHHLLLAFCDRYPSIRTAANGRVSRFIKDPKNRDKERTHDVGELLIDLAISDYSWDDFSPAWIEEAFIRNARWILAKYPNLFEKEQGASSIQAGEKSSQE
jgi:Zn-finger protein